MDHVDTSCGKSRCDAERLSQAPEGAKNTMSTTPEDKRLQNPTNGLCLCLCLCPRGRRALRLVVEAARAGALLLVDFLGGARA